MFLVHKIRWTVVLMMVALLTTLFSTLSLSANENSSEQVRVYVEYAQSESSRRSRGMSAAAANVYTALSISNAEMHYHFEESNSFVVTISQDTLREIESNPNVASVEVDPIRELMSSSHVENATAAESAVQSIPYGVKRVQSREVWADGYTGAGRTICVIDSGYYMAHQDLKSGVQGMSQISGQAFTEDKQGHGSHVAGTIAALDNNKGVVGVAPNADLFIVKLFNNNGKFQHGSDVSAAVQTCQQNGANIINMSLSGSSSSSHEQSVMDSVYESGVLIIASAGNSGGSDLDYPASYDNVISVAATDDNNNKDIDSQYNRQVELGAPGVDVRSVYSAGKGRYVKWTGTSMAAPHVSGVAALIWSANPSWTNIQVRDALQQTALDLGSSGRDDLFGFGLIQAKAALDYLNANGNALPPTSTPAPAPLPIPASSDDSLRIASSGKCVEMSSSNIVQRSCNSEDNQRLQKVSANGGFMLQFVNSDQCLKGVKKALSAGTCNSSNPKFVFNWDGNQLRSVKYRRKCITVTGNLSSDGATIGMKNCSNSSAQQFDQNAAPSLQMINTVGEAVVEDVLPTAVSLSNNSTQTNQTAPLLFVITVFILMTSLFVYERK